MNYSYTYIRCSTPGQETSPEVQRQICHEAHQRDGTWPPLNGDYVDFGVSARKVPFAQRPEAKRLLDVIQKGDHLITHKIDRLGRKARDIIRTVDALSERGVIVHVTDLVGMTISLDSPMGLLIIAGLSVAAELEGNAISERITAGIRYAKSKGGGATNAPPGQKLKRIKGMSVCVPDKKEMADIAWAAEKWLEGHDVLAITKQMKKLKMKRKRGRTRSWQPRSLRNALKDYFGCRTLYEYHNKIKRRRIADMTEAEKQRRNGDS